MIVKKPYEYAALKIYCKQFLFTQEISLITVLIKYSFITELLEMARRTDSTVVGS